MQFRTLCRILLQQVPVHGFFYCFQFLRQFRLLPFFFSLFRNQCQNDTVCIIQQVGLNQRFIIVGMYGIPKFLQHLFVFQAAQRIHIINPRIHNRETVDQSFGIGSEVRFPQLELRAVQRSFQQLLVNSFHGNLLQIMIQRLYESVFPLRLAATGANRENILQHTAAYAAGNIFGNATVKQSPAQRRAF